MTTITLKINEKTKAGKAFLAIVDFFKTDKENVILVDKNEQIDISKNFYSKEIIKKIKKAEENIKKGNTTRLNPNNIWESIL